MMRAGVGWKSSSRLSDAVVSPMAVRFPRPTKKTLQILRTLRDATRQAFSWKKRLPSSAVKLPYPADKCFTLPSGIRIQVLRQQFKS